MDDKLVKDMLYVPFGDIIRGVATGIAEAQFDLDKSSMTVAELMAGQRILRDADSGQAILNEDGSPTVVDSRVFFGHSYELKGSGAQAKAVVGTIPGTVISLQIVSGGSGYPETTGTPLELIFTGDGTNAKGEAIVDGTGTITELRLIEGGSGYTVAPTVSVNNSAGSGLSINAEIDAVEDAIVDIQVEDAGEGYSVPPHIRFISEEGQAAAATALVTERGTIEGFSISNPGQGYTTAPIVEILAGHAILPQKLSMMELGFVPNFYQFVETVIEMKMVIRINKVAGKKGNNAHRLRMFGATVDANYASSYNFDVNFASTIKTKILPIPPPTVLEDRIRKIMEANDLLEDELPS